MAERGDQVARLLADSKAAHDRARLARHQRRLEDARLELTTARDLRLQAHALDPDHESPAWATEQVHTGPGHDTHADMLAFYAHQLGT